MHPCDRFHVRGPGYPPGVKGALDVHRDLLEHDVHHEVVRVRGGVASADDLPRVLDVDAGCCVAVRCYVTDVGFVAVAVRSGAVPDPAAVLDALGATTLRAAGPGQVNAATDYAAGLVSPLALPPDVVLLLDRSLTSGDVVYCPVGEGGVVVALHSRDLVARTGAQVVDLSAQPLPAGSDVPWSGGARVIDLDRRAVRSRRPTRRTAG